MRIILLFILIIMLLPGGLYGQSLASNGENLDIPEDLIEYFKLRVSDHHVKKISGKYYLSPYFNANEHQYFRSKIPFDGIIHTWYDTIHCKGIYFDLFREKIQVYSPEHGVIIEMDEQTIRGFDLMGPDGEEKYNFTRLESDRADINYDGFYQFLAAGEQLSLYKKHYKLFTEVPREGYSVVKFEKHEYFVLESEGRYYKFKKNKELFDLFPDHGKEIKRYFKSELIDFRSVSDLQSRQAIIYLDELISEPAR